MNTKKSMKRLLDSLTAIKASRHNVAETSVDENLDEAIKLLEQCIKDGSYKRVSRNEFLVVIGRVLERLPSIVALLKLFSD
jgi:hypothetical protein